MTNGANKCASIYGYVKKYVNISDIMDKVLIYYGMLRYMQIHMYKYNKKNMKNVLSVISNVQTKCLKLDFQKAGLHKGDKWFIHGTEHHKDNHLPGNNQSLL